CRLLSIEQYFPKLDVNDDPMLTDWWSAGQPILLIGGWCRQTAGICEEYADHSPSRGLRCLSLRCTRHRPPRAPKHAIRRSSSEEVRRHDAKEFARGDHLGFLPKFRKMTRIAGHQVVGASGIGAFQKDIVVWIGGDLERPRRLHRLRMAPNELQEL